MKTIANSKEEAEQKFGRAFYGGKTQPELDERVQMGKFLEIAVEHGLFNYPIEVLHDRQRKPDFRLTTAQRTIGIEATKIANPNLEQARVLQRRHGLGTLSVSPF